jgi:hypothetical protein
LDFGFHRLQERRDISKKRLGRRRIVTRDIADVEVGGNEGYFRPSMDGDVRFGKNVYPSERVFPERMVFSGDFGESMLRHERTDEFANAVHSEFADSRKIATVEICEDMGSGRYRRCVSQIVS